MSTLSLVCKMEACPAPHIARGFCGTHYRQMSRGSLSPTGEYIRVVRSRGIQEGTCKVAGCPRTDLSGFNFCKRHWKQVHEGKRAKTGELLVEIRGSVSEFCQEPDCGKASSRRGWCRKHAWRGRTERNGEGTCTPMRVGKGWRVDPEGYRLVSVRMLYSRALKTEWGRLKYGKGAKFQWAREHRLIVELSLDRALSRGEIVHHRDGNRLNNKLENLELTVIGKHIPGHIVAPDEALSFLSRFIYPGMTNSEGMRKSLQELLVRLDGRS